MGRAARDFARSHPARYKVVMQFQLQPTDPEAAAIIHETLSFFKKILKPYEFTSAAFGQFRTIVKYVCCKRGKFFAEVDTRGTSQECPECGAEVRKDLSVRVHSCPNCSYTTNRDVASSQVIRNRGIALISTLGLRGTETVCAVDLLGAGATQPRQVAKTRKGRTRKVSL